MPLRSQFREESIPSLQLTKAARCAPSASSLACFETQLAGSRPFRVAIEVYGLENVLVLAIVRSTSSELKYLDYDPDTCNRNCWFEHPQMSEGECPAPQVVRDPDGTFARFPIMCNRPDA